jgi:hypothetical protein
MTIPIALRRKMPPQRLTVGHRDVRNPRCGFELINAAANFRRRGSLTVTGRALRHCERREAIQKRVRLDCFVASLLAMTATRRKMPKNATQLWIT